MLLQQCNLAAFKTLFDLKKSVREVYVIVNNLIGPYHFLGVVQNLTSFTDCFLPRGVCRLVMRLYSELCIPPPNQFTICKFWNAL